MPSLEEMAKKEILLNKSEIFSLEFENQKYWVKKARATIPNKIQKFFYRLFPFELLMPSFQKNAKEALEYETTKFELFRNYKINVPKVVYVYEDFFILEDVGVTVHSLIRDKNISEKQLYYYIDKVIELLATIHNKNQFHGGAQTRNFTYQNGNVFAIDLEESFSKELDIETLKFRDFLLLLLSFVKIKAMFEVDYKMIIEKYVLLTGNNQIVNQLKELAQRVSFLIFLAEIKWINQLLGSDVKGFLTLFKILKKL